MDRSPYVLTKRLETHVNGVLNALDLYDLPKMQASLVKELQRELIDARLDTRDYELSETREEQLANAKEGKRRLELARRHLLKASEYDLFSAIDVAQLSAQIEHIIERLE